MEGTHSNGTSYSYTMAPPGTMGADYYVSRKHKGELKPGEKIVCFFLVGGN